MWYIQKEDSLLKVEKGKECKDEEISIQITVKYNDREGKQCIQNYTYSFKDKENTFSSEAIDNGLALYYYGQGYIKIAKLAVSIRNLDKAGYKLTREENLDEFNVIELKEKEENSSDGIKKCEEKIKKLVEITSYDGMLGHF